MPYALRRLHTRWRVSDLLTSYEKEYADESMETRVYSYTADNGTLFVNPTSIVHKTNGTQTDVWQMDWEKGRQLSSITINGGTVNYDYNENGLRTYKKQADGTEYHYYYDGSRLDYVKILDADGDLTCTMRYIYNSSGQAEYILYVNSKYATSSNQFALFYIVRDCEGKIHKLLQIRKATSSGVSAILEESVEYVYDPYGKLIAVNQPHGDAIGDYNPLIYKDYVYDFDTELYYLQSRYYDPEIGRFINADAYTSTGQDAIGTNMFAYCGNNPICRVDPTGQWWITALVVTVIVACTMTLSGCSMQPTPNTGAASPYTPSNSTDYNCYAYALGEEQWKYVGGSSEAVKNFDVDTVAEMVLADAQKDGKMMRIIDSYDSPIESNEYRIALRTGEGDYHFMKQHNNGSWSHKPGFCSTRLIDGANPSVISWDAPRVDMWYLYNYGIVKETGTVPNYYNSKTVYFAVSK